MIRSLNTAVLGIKQFQTSLDAIGNNLANINTIGYKGARVDFSDTLAQTLRAPTPDTAAASGTAGMQLGNGVKNAYQTWIGGKPYMSPAASVQPIGEQKTIYQRLHPNLNKINQESQSKSVKYKNGI